MFAPAPFAVTAETVPFRMIGGQSAQRRRQRPRITGRNEQAGTPILHDESNP